MYCYIHISPYVYIVHHHPQFIYLINRIKECGLYYIVGEFNPIFYMLISIVIVLDMTNIYNTKNIKSIFKSTYTIITTFSRFVFSVK